MRAKIQDPELDNLMKMIRKIAKNNRFFHWYIEFPEVFSSDRGGFDCILTFTDKSNIMILSTLLDFNNNFFNLYKFEDFKQFTHISHNLKELKEDIDAYLKLNGVEYNSYYLLKAIKILGENFKMYQHEKLQLLFIRNSKYASLICPKF